MALLMVFLTGSFAQIPIGQHIGKWLVFWPGGKW